MDRLLTTIFFNAGIILCNGQDTLKTLENKALNNQNPEKWDIKLFQQDRDKAMSGNKEPFNYSAFPVEEYEYYVFSKPFEFRMDNAHFSGMAFGENKPITEDRYVFKHEMAIIFYTGKEFAQINGHVSSRNYPYLTVQGRVELKHPFDFLGIKSIKEDSGYIIVNLKSFDLRFGQTILIFPKEDNSFYYLQSMEKPVSDEEFEEFLINLKNDHRIIEMTRRVRN